MPSILRQYGFGRGVYTEKFDATSLANENFVVRIPRSLASVAEITRDKISVLAISEGEPFLVRPRDTLTLHVGDSEVLMTVLGVHPLAALCQRHGVIDRAVLVLAVA